MVIRLSDEYLDELWRTRYPGIDVKEVAREVLAWYAEYDRNRRTGTVSITSETEAAESEADILLDLLPAAWAVEDWQFERLLQVPEGWLQAWRNHEAQLDDPIRTRLDRLYRFHRTIRLVVSASGYAEWLHRTWIPDSPIGDRSPLEAALAGPAATLETIEDFIRSA